MNTPRPLLLALALCAVAWAGCDQGYGSPEATHFGAAQRLGRGAARTYLDVSAAGEPLALGVALSADALAGLPSGGDHAHDLTLSLALPAQARALGLPFDRVDVGWNPRGHAPGGASALPHFDVHFTLLTRAGDGGLTSTEPRTAPERLLRGSHDGDGGPVLTQAFLEALPRRGPFEVPLTTARDAAAPTRYVVRYDAERDEYRVALGGFGRHAAG